MLRKEAHHLFFYAVREVSMQQLNFLCGEDLLFAQVSSVFMQSRIYDVVAPIIVRCGIHADSV
jgi:hypothetical protein